MTTPAWLLACSKEAEKGFDPNIKSYHMGWSAAMESDEVKALKTKVEFQETLLASFGALITKLKAETVDQAKTIVLLTEDLQYIAGIVEKGTGSTVKEDSNVRAAILWYVQALEKERDALKAELSCLRNQGAELAALKKELEALSKMSRKP